MMSFLKIIPAYLLVTLGFAFSKPFNNILLMREYVHILLWLCLQSYMEDHLRNKDRLETEWAALCAYESEPCATTIIAQRVIPFLRKITSTRQKITASKMLYQMNACQHYY